MLADNDEVFRRDFIRHLDGDKSLIVDVFNESASAVVLMVTAEHI